MSTATARPIRGKVLGIAAALAMLLGLAGAGLAANEHANAQSPTATSTATPTSTAGRATPTAPTTGSGLVNDDGSSLTVPIIALAVVMLGGGVAFAVASRKEL
ncbi:MAG: hypothetical protein ACM3S1_03270 [Hyphomicrobiales bacterium]